MNVRQEVFTKLFPSLNFNYFENYLNEDTITVSMHWHNRLEIIHVLEGEGMISINLQEHPLSAGDIVAVMPGSLHSVHGTHGQILHSQTVSFTLDIPEFHEPFFFEPVIHPHMPGNPALVHTMDAIFQLCTDRKEGCETLFLPYLTALFQLFSYYGYQQEGTTSVSADSQALKKVLQYMDEHYAEKLSISLLSQICGYSKYHFCRFFSASMDCSCKKYLQQLRIRKARNLLETTSLSIAEISHLTGFEEVSYFISVFRKLEECTPLQYRKKMKSSLIHIGIVHEL